MDHFDDLLAAQWAAGEFAGSTEDFQAVFEKASGQDLSAFFDTWVRTPVKPVQ